MSGYAVAVRVGNVEADGVTLSNITQIQNINHRTVISSALTLTSVNMGRTF